MLQIDDLNQTTRFSLWINMKGARCALNRRDIETAEKIQTHITHIAIYAQDETIRDIAENEALMLTAAIRRMKDGHHPDTPIIALPSTPVPNTVPPYIADKATNVVQFPSGRFA